MYIRIGEYHLSFSTIDTEDTENPISYEPYVVKSNMSIAANLREALKGAGLKQMGIVKAVVLIDAPILLIPVEAFEEQNMDEMFRHSFPNRKQEQVLYNVLPDLNTVAVFSVNKDLKLVLDDNFADVKITVAMQPVWRHLHRRSFFGARNKLYGYVHEQELDIFSFHQNRFKFYNRFETHHERDALYFLLYVWKQLALNNEHDELHLLGSFFGYDTQADRDKQKWLTDELHRYLQNVYTINPSAEFNRAPVTKIKGMPFDLMALFTKGQ